MKSKLFAVSAMLMGVAAIGMGEKIYTCTTAGGMLACTVVGILLLGVAICLAALAVNAANEAEQAARLRRVSREHSNSWRDVG